MWGYDLPIEVFLDILLPLLSLTDICVLAQVNVGWRDVCSDEDVWRVLYMRTNPGKIVDTSIHVGSRRGKDRRVRNRNAEYEFYKRTSTVSKPIYFRREPFTRSSTIHCKTSYDFLNRSWCCGCMPQDLKKNLLEWREVRTDGGTDNIFPYIPDGWTMGFRDHETRDYSEYVISKWRSYNEEKGLSSKALCQNPDHYLEETLGISEECRKIKSYKKATLIRMCKKVKKANKKRESEMKKAEKEFEKAYKIMVEMKRRMVEKGAWVERGERTLESLECCLKK
jgi:hypothetical protein